MHSLDNIGSPPNYPLTKVICWLSIVLMKLNSSFLLLEMHWGAMYSTSGTGWLQNSIEIIVDHWRHPVLCGCGPDAGSYSSSAGLWCRASHFDNTANLPNWIIDEWSTTIQTELKKTSVVEAVCQVRDITSTPPTVLIVIVAPNSRVAERFEVPIFIDQSDHSSRTSERHSLTLVPALSGLWSKHDRIIYRSIPSLIWWPFWPL